MVNEALKRGGVSERKADLLQAGLELGLDAASTGISAKAIIAAKGPSPPWSKGPGPRGLDLETGPVGHRLPKGFKTFDYFDPETGTATSQKSIDILQNYKDPKGIVSTGKKAINSILDFEDYSKAGVELTAENIRVRRLDVFIPKGAATETHRQALGQIRAYGLDNGVVVRIIER